jgi:hypothetical protein
VIKLAKSTNPLKTPMTPSPSLQIEVLRLQPEDDLRGSLVTVFAALAAD